MNSVVLIGRLARDPELSYTANTQTAVCHFTLAVSRPRRNGEDQGADFLRVTVFGRQAENCDRYLAKGRQCAVHGRIETGSYKNREGVNVNTFDIIADNVEFLGGQQGQGQGGFSQQQGGYGQQGFGQQSQGGFVPQQPAPAPQQAPQGGQPTEIGAPGDGFTSLQDDDIPF